MTRFALVPLEDKNDRSTNQTHKYKYVRYSKLQHLPSHLPPQLSGAGSYVVRTTPLCTLHE